MLLLTFSVKLLPIRPSNVMLNLTEKSAIALIWMWRLEPDSMWCWSCFCWCKNLKMIIIEIQIFVFVFFVMFFLIQSDKDSLKILLLHQLGEIMVNKKYHYKIFLRGFPTSGRTTQFSKFSNSNYLN